MRLRIGRRRCELELLHDFHREFREILVATASAAIVATAVASVAVASIVVIVVVVIATPIVVAARSAAVAAGNTAVVNLDRRLIFVVTGAALRIIGRTFQKLRLLETEKTKQYILGHRIHYSYFNSKTYINNSRLVEI